MTFRVLKELCKKHDPDFVFLKEIKNKNSKMEKLRKNIGFGECMYVDFEGLSGGLAFMVEKEMVVKVLVGNKILINIIVLVPKGAVVVRIFWIFGALVF